MTDGKRPNIVVALDGTLIHTDLLLERVFLFVRRWPWRFLNLILWGFKGKAYFKRRMADAVIPDVTRLPYDKELLAWLEERQRAGAGLSIATASDARIARNVAEHLKMFDEVFGPEETNLAGGNKRDVLVRRYGEGGYEYVGNSSDDIPAWKAASAIHLVNPGWGVLSSARRIGPVGTLIQNRPAYLPTLLRALRVHQWAKNLLVFVPLLTAHRIFDADSVRVSMFAFIAFCACASSVYLLNDLLDLDDDRRHPTKCNRPIASGGLPILHALSLIPALLLAAFSLAFWKLPIPFTLVLAAYYLLTLAYSLRIKRVVILDVLLLAMLYTIRVIAGAAAVDLVVTSWIVAFSMFIFLSLAFMKRYTELRDAREKGKQEQASGRSYYPSDSGLLATLGGASGYISVLVLALYIDAPATDRLYRTPEWLWAVCPLLLFWISRIWLLAHRGQMHDDPIVFALNDKVSWWTGALFLAFFALGIYA